MGISDMQFDILHELREEVLHLPRSKRRKAFLELAKKLAQDFVDTATSYDLAREDSCDEESDDTSEGAQEPRRKVSRTR